MPPDMRATRSAASANVSVRPPASSTNGASSLAFARRSNRSARVTSPENATRKRSSWFTCPSYPAVGRPSLAAWPRSGEIDPGDLAAVGELAQRRVQVAPRIGLELGLDRHPFAVAADRERFHVAAVDLVQSRHHVARVGAVLDVDDR